MEKNWLIRTQFNKILGPVSKDKVKEFIEKGSLSSEDEITMGNGHWFSIREKDLLDKHVFGDLPQGFCPVSADVPSVLTNQHEREFTNTLGHIPKSLNEALPSSGDLDFPEAGEIEGQVIPVESDLEFPDIGDSSDSSEEDPTMMKKVNLAKLNEISGEVAPRDNGDDYLPPSTEEEMTMTGVLPSDIDLAFPEIAKSKVELPKIEKEELKAEIEPIDEEEARDIDSIQMALEESSLAKKSKIKIKSSKKQNENESLESKKKSFNLLFILVFIIVASIFIGIVGYYYKVVLNKKIPFIGQVISTISLVQTAYAQEAQIGPISKKKSYF